ncbi:helix-turn-helix domain-containing protein [Aestuariimicrobium soli]|uniref:helix-turn-helix domain-containing protein n=1 Tax=Aestuariimicrobium soli TaxID=2035834 RepID=UPI003EC0E9D4
MHHPQGDDHPTVNDGQVLALARGLEILEILVRADRPVSGAELARRTGLHPSSITRLARTLIAMGYVAKDAEGLRPDYGVLDLTQSARGLPGIARVQPLLEQVAHRHPGWFVNLCLLRNGHLTYLVRCLAGHSTTVSLGFPLHKSSAAMRLLVDEDEAVALEWLQQSRRRHGWSGGAGLPADEAAALAWARRQVRDDVLVIDGWSGHSLSAAIPVSDPNGHAMALAVASSRSDATPDRMRAALAETRREVEVALRRPRR